MIEKVKQIDVIPLTDNSGNISVSPELNADLFMDFVSIMIHDLQAPLAGMKTLLRFLNRDKFNPQNKIHQDLLKSASIALERSESIIHDIFDAVKAEKVGIPFNLDGYNINEIIENSIDMIRESAFEYGIKIQNTLPPDSHKVQADRNLLLRVLDNLLFNAFKHSPHGGSVFVEVEHSSDEVIVSIRDEGSGFAGINSDDLFDKYKQVDLRKKGKYKGAGLGLYFCRMAVQAMSGRIWAEETAAGGACFKFTLVYGKE